MNVSPVAGLVTGMVPPSAGETDSPSIRSLASGRWGGMLRASVMRDVSLARAGGRKPRCVTGARNRPSGPSAGKGDHRREAALGGALDRQARLAPVELLEPAPGVGETHALPQRGAVGALAVVADLDPQGA